MKKKYCSRCGNLIDRETKKCTGCGKQYCRGIRFTKFSVTILVLSFFLVALLGLNIFQLTVINAQPEKDVDAIEGKESSVVKVFCYDHNGNEIGTGSGVILFHDDMVVTNYHVVEDAYSVKVSTDQDITYKAAGIWHKHVKRDIAILKLETGTKLSPLEIGNSLLVKKGEEVTAIGSPLGIKNTISKGNLSARLMQDDYDVLQFTAPISPGSSGGALLNGKGEVIGITFASLEEGQNLNLAIPIELVDSLYQTKLPSVEPDPFEADYWDNRREEYFNFTYGKVIPTSFANLKNTPQYYCDKRVSVEAFVSSGTPNKLLFSMYISPQKTAQPHDQNETHYSTLNFSEHNLLKISSARILHRTGTYVSGKVADRKKVRVIGVFCENYSGEYEIRAEEVIVL